MSDTENRGDFDAEALRNRFIQAAATFVPSGTGGGLPEITHRANNLRQRRFRLIAGSGLGAAAAVIVVILVVNLAGSSRRASPVVPAHSPTPPPVATIPLVTCSTEHGIDETPSPLPTDVPSPAEAKAGAPLAYFADQNGFLRVLAPAGWQCSALDAADGNTGVEVWPSGGSDPTTGGHVGIVANRTPACVGCMYEAVCALISVPDLAVGQGPCPTREPAGEVLHKYATDVIGIRDPAGVKGDADLSGGPDPASGVLIFHPAHPSEADDTGCALPVTEQEICVASTTDFVSRYGSG